MNTSALKIVSVLNVPNDFGTQTLLLQRTQNA